MSISENTFNGYEEIIEAFDFREKGAIKIPKEVREFAYALSVDIEIQSTIGNDYLNGKSSPAHGFFGYVVLVFRNYSVREIPISLARQNLYYDTVPEAFVNWYQLYSQLVHKREIEGQNLYILTPIADAVSAELPEEVIEVCSDWSGFVELPLREVYVKTRFGTRFKLEVSYWKPNPVKYGDCEYEGESLQTDDPVKDDGLPDETQPQTTDPENPYEGTSPPSSAEELGAFFNPKQGTLDNPNSANAIDPTGQNAFNYDDRIGKWWVVVTRDGDGSCNVRTGDFPEDEIPFAIDHPPNYSTELVNPNVCPSGETIYQARVTSALTGALIFQTSGRYGRYNLLPVSPPP
jgi:hypothetical protein